jgi:hypothetical protein
VCVCECERESVRDSFCVCVCEREFVCENGRERVYAIEFVYVCVCVRERDEREIVCVSV